MDLKQQTYRRTDIQTYRHTDIHLGTNETKRFPPTSNYAGIKLNKITSN